LHFGIYLDGVAVLPVEWWDPKWIDENIKPKLEGRSGQEIAEAQHPMKGNAEGYGETAAIGSDISHETAILECLTRSRHGSSPSRPHTRKTGPQWSGGRLPTSSCKSGSRRTCAPFPAPTPDFSWAGSSSSTSSRHAKSRRDPSRIRFSSRRRRSDRPIPTGGSRFGKRRLNWLAATPTELGTITTDAQVNLFSLDFDGKTKLSLWRLYARNWRHFVAGKAYSTFVDPDALPTTLDFNGPSGSTAVQQWLARAIVPMGAGGRSQAASRIRRRIIVAGRRGFGVHTDARRPDVAAHLRFDSERGHVQLSGLSRRIDVRSTAGFGTHERTFDASGLAISGSLATFGDDSVVASYTTGKGIGRYFDDSVSSTAWRSARTIVLGPHPHSGATLYYQQFLDAGPWMTVGGASTLWASECRARARPCELTPPHVYVSANPDPSVFCSERSSSGRTRSGERRRGRRRHGDERAVCSSTSAISGPQLVTTHVRTRTP
jgi:hypothetical protein